MKNIDYQMWTRNGGLILALLWAGFWVWFGLASGISEELTPMGVLLHTAVPGLCFFLVVIIAWRWVAVGGMLLLLAGMVVLIAYPLMTYQKFPLATIIFVLLTMALPPLLAGVLLFTSWWQARPSGHEVGPPPGVQT